MSIDVLLKKDLIRAPAAHEGEETMDVSTAFSRRQTLRAEQNYKTKLQPEAVDYEAMTAFAAEDGVPPALAGLTKGAYKDAADEEYAVIGRALEAMEVIELEDGLWVVAQSAKAAGGVASAIYTGALARGLAAKWFGFPELSTAFTDRVSMSARAEEWEQGQMADWLWELDSMRYCYDLLVIHGVTETLLTDFVAKELYSLLAIRYGRGLFTVVTSRVGGLGEDTAARNSLRLMMEEAYALHRIGGR